MIRRKKPLKRSSPPRRSTTPTRRSPIKTKKRKPSEFARIYGSKARVKFVKSLSCYGCGGGPCENHHIVNGGMGRKADYTSIIPLCFDCHRKLHGLMRGKWPNEILAAVAHFTELAWQAHCARVSQERTPE